MYISVPTPSLSRPIFWSTIAHFAFIVFISVAPIIRWPFAERPMQFVWVELPRGTGEEITTGMKESEGLPKSTIQEQKEWFTKLKEKPKEPAMPGPAKETKKQEDTKKMKEALAKVERTLKQRTVVPEAAQIKDKGEGYKYGTGTEPLMVPVDDPEYIKYQAMVRAKIMQEWIIPLKWVETPDRPKARVIVMIDEAGEIVSTKWDKQSGDASFDASCLRAVQRSSPFDEPPERLKWEVYNEGFLVEFDPRLAP